MIKDDISPLTVLAPFVNTNESNPMPKKAILSAIALVALSSLPTQAAETVGVQSIKLHSTERESDLNVVVWYPASGGGKAALIGDNQLFVGAPALDGATAASGKFPLIVLSHGSGGNVLGMAWLATRLVEAGFVVAGPNHPGTTSGNSLPAETPKVWKRTRDLSDLIDYLTNDPAWSQSVDATRIGVVGFSLGGAAALEIAGARANLENYARYCDGYKLWDCGFYIAGRGYEGDKVIEVDKVDLRKIDRAKFEQSNRDARIKSAVMVDPGLAHVVEDASLREISIPMAFINLGDHATIPMAVDSGRIARVVPNGSFAAVSGANHFSFLQRCKPGAAEFLKKVGEPDPICTDPSDRPRQEIHDEIADLVLGALTRSLK